MAYIYFLMSLLLTSFSRAQEYAYPVFVFPDNTIGLVYQRDMQSIELHALDIATNSIFSGLFSRYMPAYCMMLPSGLGFSFLDNGIIRIKYFDRRSPKTLEFSDPLHHINSMIWDGAWDGSMRMYMSARQTNRYELFQIDINGSILYNLSSQKHDFLYPQKQGSRLFFISRSIVNQEASYAVSEFKFEEKCDQAEEKLNDTKLYIEEKKIAFQGENCANNCLNTRLESDEYQSHQHCIKNGDLNAVNTIVDFGNQPIAFLSMDTDKTGFVVSHPISIDVVDGTDIIFSYYYLYQDTNDGQGADRRLESSRHAQGDSERCYADMPVKSHTKNNEHFKKSWHTKKLFDFAIPASFIVPDGNDRLYEQMTPLLPKKIDDFIYCSHAVNGVLNIFRYDLTTSLHEQVTFSQSPRQHYFCPLKVGSQVYCGGTLPSGAGANLLKCIG